jgi:hypothetical protein
VKTCNPSTWVAETTLSQNKKKKWGGLGVAKVVEHLPSMHKVQSHYHKKVENKK